MKVILTEDVDKLGELNEVVEVADGYARNYLLPRSMALPATKSAMANLDNLKKVGERREGRLRGAAEEDAKKFDGKKIVLEAKTGEGGRLFGSVTPADIMAALKKQLGVNVDRKQIHLGEAVRWAGEYPVEVALHKDVKPTVTIQVGDLSMLPKKPVEKPVEKEEEVAA